MHKNQAPVMFYDVRNGRNAGDTYKSNKLNVDEWTEVDEIAYGEMNGHESCGL